MACSPPANQFYPNGGKSARRRRGLSALCDITKGSPTERAVLAHILKKAALAKEVKVEVSAFLLTLIMIFFLSNSHPTVLVLVEKLGRDRRWVPGLVPHFVTDLLAL